MIIVLGLIGLVLFQGISKPVSSLSALEPVLPHAVGEILEDQSVLLNLLVEGVVIYFPPNTFGQSRGRVVVSIKNSNQGDYDIKSDWLDYRELNMIYLDAKSREYAIWELEKPVDFCFSFSEEKSSQRKCQKT